VHVDARGRGARQRAGRAAPGDVRAAVGSGPASIGRRTPLRHAAFVPLLHSCRCCIRAAAAFVPLLHSCRAAPHRNAVALGQSDVAAACVSVSVPVCVTLQ
jgi:hypothetical protein